jgi:hypothetical protein
MPRFCGGSGGIGVGEELVRESRKVNVFDVKVALPGKASM